MNLSEDFYVNLNLCLNTRCNICRKDCPKYLAEKMEFNSPRGKLELIGEALKGTLSCESVSEEVVCVLSCNECYSSCPHGMHIPDIFVEFRKSCSGL